LLTGFGVSSAAGLNAYIPLLLTGLIARYTSLIELREPYTLLEHPAVLLTLGILLVHHRASIGGGDAVCSHKRRCRD